MRLIEARLHNNRAHRYYPIFVSPSLFRLFQAAIVWDIETGALRSKLIGYTEPFDSVAFSTDKEYCITACSNQAILWLVKTSDLHQWRVLLAEYEDEIKKTIRNIEKQKNM